MGLAPRIFKAHEYQQIAIDFMLTTPRCALWAGMGLGKTVSSMTVAEILRFVGYTDPILVLGPMRVARDTWPGEIEKWAHLRHLHIVPMVGARAVREAALKQRADIFSINYDNLPWLVESLRGKPWPFQVVFADESTRLKGYRTKQGGVRTQALAEVARHTERWVNLTGTPSPNGLKDLWGQYWFLDHGERLGRTYTAFHDRWFYTDLYTKQVKPHRHAEKEIYERIADITLSINAKDWFDIKDPIENVVRVPLPANCKAQYRQLEKEMFTELASGHEIEVFNAAALSNKCRQFANGAVYLQPGKDDWAPVHDAKLDALESVIEEAGGDQILVSYEFRSDRDRILQRFKSSADISTLKGLKAFKDGDVQLGVAHPKSMGHGIDGLQEGCHRAVYFGTGWDLELHQQILERVGPVRQLQSGFDRPVWVTYIVCDDSIDDVILERHASKRGVQELLLDAMSRRM